MKSLLASLILTLFFIGIDTFLMIDIVELPDASNGGAALAFVIISFVVLLIVVGAARLIEGAVGAHYAGMNAMTIIYAILASVINFALCDMDSSSIFVLINLILIFIYLCVVIPMFVSSSDAQSDEGEHGLNLSDDRFKIGRDQ